MNVVRSFAIPVLEALNDGKRFGRVWNSGGPWVDDTSEMAPSLVWEGEEFRLPKSLYSVETFFESVEAGRAPRLPLDSSRSSEQNQALTLSSSYNFLAAGQVLI